MKKKTEDILKKLFDYQKFEGDPKLNQTIKDDKLSSNSFITEKELAAVTGGTEVFVKRYTIDCPKCKMHTLYCIETIAPFFIQFQDACSNCDYKNTEYIDLGKKIKK